MATYFSKENVPTMYARDPEHVLYNEALSGNMPYVNYPSMGNVGGSNQSHQNISNHSVASNIVLPGSSMTREDLITSRLGNHQYSAWRDGRDEHPFIQSVSGPVENTSEFAQNHVTDDPQMSLGMQLNFLNGQNLALAQSNLSAVKGQGLSLSLGTQIQASSFQYHPGGSNVSLMGPHQITSGNVEPTREDNSRDRQTHVYPSPYGLSTLASTIPNSKYLKAAQQLLDEVVSVRKALKSKLEKGQTSAGNACPRESDEGSKSDGKPSDPNEPASNASNELSPSERQDLQNKMTKLLAMLDEVDRRYKQYYNQMQIVVSSFDVIAGCSASKPYTALALQTISRHFRCLRDAINGQIQATRKSLGEQDGSSMCGGISRLRYIDQHLKQQRAFQQFGMMQPHAWRPQRGLPENSVSILRAWLFEHFLHPYPKDSDKIMLARQTGLTRSQVSNWFINARVRLWKPMVEEMYKEEIGDAEIESNSSSENAPKSRDELGLSEDKDDYQSMKFATEKSPLIQFNDTSKSSLLPDVGADGAASGFRDKVSAESMNYMNHRTSGLDTTTENAPLLQDTLIQTEGNVRFMPYQMAELERYGNAGVSLTLGLQHCEGGLQVSDGQHGFVSMRGDEMFNAAPSVGTDTADYSYMNLADNRHRFGPSQLLHDFVA